jgi:hypothetical protein
MTFISIEKVYDSFPRELFQFPKAINFIGIQLRTWSSPGSAPYSFISSAKAFKKAVSLWRLCCLHRLQIRL